MRGDTVELCTYAVSKGLRVGLSTNGTLITRDYAQRIAEAGVSYVGVSIDGLEATHDKFRNERGAFRRGLEGLKNARDAGIKTGIRFTVNRHNVSELPAVTDLLVRYQIPAFCCIISCTQGGRVLRWTSPTKCELRWWTTSFDELNACRRRN